MKREQGSHPSLDTPRRVLAEGLVSTGRFQAIEMLSEPLFVVEPCWNPAAEETVVDIHAGKFPLLTSNLLTVRPKSLKIGKSGAKQRTWLVALILYPRNWDCSTNLSFRVVYFFNMTV